MAIERRDSFDGEFDAVLAAARAGAPWALERIYEALSPAVAGLFRGQRRSPHTRVLRRTRASKQTLILDPSPARRTKRRAGPRHARSRTPRPGQQPATRPRLHRPRARGRRRWRRPMPGPPPSRGLRPATSPPAMRPRAPQIWRSGLGWQRTTLRPGPEHGPRGPASGEGSAGHRRRNRRRTPPASDPSTDRLRAPGLDLVPTRKRRRAGHRRPPGMARRRKLAGIMASAVGPVRAHLGPPTVPQGPKTIPVVGSMVTPARPRPSMCRHRCSDGLSRAPALVAWSIRRCVAERCVVGRGRSRRTAAGRLAQCRRG
jgi:hypothetical protein